MLLIDGRINSKFTAHSNNLNIRSGVGVINDGKIIFLISTEKINFFDFAFIFKDIFHCKNALYLDGAISEMYFKGSGKKPLGEFGPMIGVSRIK